jgi:hypothetical protein
MIELRWVEFGPNKQLEYRTKILSGRRLVTVGATADVWSDWVVVPTVSGDEAALGDLIASGGIVGSP